MKDPKRYTCDIVSTEAGHLPLLLESDGTGAAAGCYVRWEDYQELFTEYNFTSRMLDGALRKTVVKKCRKTEANRLKMIKVIESSMLEAVMLENQKLISRLASVEAILKVCFSKEPLKITHYTKNRND